MSLPTKGQRTKTKITLPSVKLPGVPDGTRNPPGWNVTEISLKQRGASFAADFKTKEPAGDPPPDFEGTRPEWAIYWACLQRGLQPNADFVFQAKMPGIGASYYSTLDFLFSDWDIGVDVQGVFWHYEQGSDKIEKDTQRRALFMGLGLTIVYIDEDLALESPEYYLDEALQGRDHSRLGAGL